MYPTVVAQCAVRERAAENCGPTGACATQNPVQLREPAVRGAVTRNAAVLNGA